MATLNKLENTGLQEIVKYHHVYEFYYDEVTDDMGYISKSKSDFIEDFAKEPLIKQTKLFFNYDYLFYLLVVFVLNGYQETFIQFLKQFAKFLET